MRILHVEDDEDTRTLVAFILEREGWNLFRYSGAVFPSEIESALASGARYIRYINYAPFCGSINGDPLEG
jgi:CheY-like chemotaxis protein